MPDQVETKQNKSSPEKKLGEKLVEILGNVLYSGEWESSLFLKNVKKQLENLKNEAVSFVGHNNEGQAVGGAELAYVRDNIAKEGYLRIYVLLYQFDSNNLQSWLSLVKSLTEYNVSRPTYDQEPYVQELIRSKKEVERYGYAIINIKQNDIYSLEKRPIDVFGHEILILKEKAIKTENILEFIHANKRKYAFRDSKLHFIGE